MSTPATPVHVLVAAAGHQHGKPREREGVEATLAYGLAFPSYLRWTGNLTMSRSLSNPPSRTPPARHRWRGCLPRSWVRIKCYAGSRSSQTNPLYRRNHRTTCSIAASSHLCTEERRPYLLPPHLSHDSCRHHQHPVPSYHHPALTHLR